MLVSPIPVIQLLTYFGIDEAELLVRKARVEVAIHTSVLSERTEPPPGSPRPTNGQFRPVGPDVPSPRPEWRQLRPRGGRVWEPDEDAALLAELDAGLPLEEVAARLGRGVLAVEVRLCKLGRAQSLQGQRKLEQAAAADVGAGVYPSSHLSLPSTKQGYVVPLKIREGTVRHYIAYHNAGRLGPLAPADALCVWTNKPVAKLPGGFVWLIVGDGVVPPRYTLASVFRVAEIGAAQQAGFKNCVRGPGHVFDPRPSLREQKWFSKTMPFRFRNSLARVKDGNLIDGLLGLAEQQGHKLAPASEQSRLPQQLPVEGEKGLRGR
jgi:hypothetical protein